MSKQHENENCLEGMRCPNSKCQSDGPFIITVTVTAKVFDDGVEDYQDPEWDDSSPCNCCSCDETGTVKNFTIDPKLERSPVALTSQELAQVLAALRHWQRDFECEPVENVKDMYPHFDEVEPMGMKAIDELCERINCG